MRPIHRTAEDPKDDSDVDDRNGQELHKVTPG